ncbi:MAG: hypothetical protein EA365_13055 [Gloeocapsa sp. DLM2.Bin57]|nr:MAG: hypothetical protein EA365_13055 [Gloeocapsa sp. DLM2.Bin57]
MSSAFEIIGLTQLRNDSEFSSLDGSGFSVVIIDTGLDTNHSLLEANYRRGYDFLEDSEEIVDTDGHGTHVAGIIGASDPDIGIATAVGLIPLRVFANNGEGDNTPLAEALDWISENQEEYNIIAVNISGGSGFYTSVDEVEEDFILNQITELETQGISVVAAGGNHYFRYQEPGLASPAIYSTLAVGATWQDQTDNRVKWRSGGIDYSTDSDRLVSFSQRLQADNFLFAPGAVINSTIPGDELGTKAGTSMATPMVTGTVVLMQQAALEFGDSLLTPQQIRDILMTTADTIFDGDDEDDNVENTELEYLRLNTYAAVREVKNRTQGNFNGSPRDDLIRGTTGNDTIRGAQGNDTLIGGAGDDLLFGGPGHNILTGGVGSDRFVLTPPGVGFQRIRDFQPGRDIIVISRRDFDLDLPPRTFLPSELFNQENGLIYNPDSGRLWFNQVAIASLRDAPPLTHRDIFVV